MYDSRLEKFLYAIAMMDVDDLPTPLSRIETLWNCVITRETPDFTDPLSRNETYLMAILELYDVDNLPTPMSRGEKLLYKLAIGDTDLSEITGYLSRYEELLVAIVESGNVGFDYVLYTLNKELNTLYETKQANIKTATMKGDTLVNILPEPATLENTAEYVSTQKLNNGHDAIGVADGEFKSAILSGQTLVNLYSADATKSTGNDNFYFINTISSSMFKPNTYTVINTSNKKLDIAIRSISSNAYIRNVRIDASTKTIVTLSNDEWIRFFIASSSDGWVNDDSNDESMLKKMVVIEGDHTQEDIPYFEGMQSVRMPGLTTIGKNLINIYDGYLQNTPASLINVENDVITITGDGAYRRYIIPIKLEKNKTYSFFGMVDGGGSLRIRPLPDGGGESVCENNTTFTMTEESGIYYVALNTGAYLGDVIYSNIQIEESPTATAYEPFKSNTLTVNEEITLRKIGDIEDEFNALTGELTERISEITLDGSENWVMVPPCKENTLVFYSSVVSDYCKKGPINCDKFIYSSVDLGAYDTADIEASYLALDGNICISINKTRLSTESVEGFIEYLQSNPVTIQYLLATETTKSIDISIVDQDGTEVSTLNSFNDGHINVSSDGLYTLIEYEVPTNNSYHLTMMKPSTTYTSVTSMACMATLDGNDISLGTNNTFTSPSTISDDLMVLDTVVEDLMIIEGDQTAKELPYFKGMNSVKMPVLTSTGKNLFNQASEINDSTVANTVVSKYIYDSSTNTSCVCSGGWVGNYKHYLKVIPNKTYYFYSEVTWGIHLVIKCNEQNIAENIISGSETDNNYYQSKVVSFVPTTDEICITYAYRTLNKNGYAKNIVISDVSITSYEPHKTNILTVNEDVTLRGIGVFKDELNLLTGEVTERIGEIILDGSEPDILQTVNTPNHTRVSMKISNSNSSIGCICNQLRTRTTEAHGEYEYIYIQNNSDGVSLSNVYIQIENSKLTAPTLEGVKTYLRTLYDSGTPLVIHYGKATESIKTVDLSVVDQNGNASKLKSYEDVTHVNLSSEDLLPTVDLEVASKIEESVAAASLLSDDVAAEQEVLNESADAQTEEVIEVMLATTEIYE